jgi:hypothetical protein
MLIILGEFSTGTMFEQICSFIHENYGINAVPLCLAGAYIIIFPSHVIICIEPNVTLM